MVSGNGTVVRNRGSARVRDHVAGGGPVRVQHAHLRTTVITIHSYMVHE